MKAERVFVLRFDDGSRIPYGVPDFMSEEEAADFLAHFRSELVEGAAQYFEQCCEPAKVEGSDNKAGNSKASGGQRLGRPRLDRSLTFSNHPSAMTLDLEERLNQLRWLGQASLAVRIRQRAVEAEAERLQIELEQRQALQMQPSRGISRG